MKDKEIVNEIKQDFKVREEEHKQIEEIAEWVCSYNCDRGVCFGGCESCDNYKLANNLYEQNYRKIPKNSVVFIPTEEQYALLSQEQYIEYLKYKEYIPELKKAFDKIRKETAREIVQKGNEYLMQSTDKAVAFACFLGMLEHDYGVEIKE